MHNYKEHDVLGFTRVVHIVCFLKKIKAKKVNPIAMCMSRLPMGGRGRDAAAANPWVVQPRARNAITAQKNF